MKTNILFFVTLLLTACGGGGGTGVEEPVVVVPTNPAVGTVLETSCDGTTLIETIADGNGGSTQETTENSEQCGYEEPQFTPEGTPEGDSYCGRELADKSLDRFQQLFDIINDVRRDDRFRNYADGEGGTYTERVVQLDESCFVQMSEPPPDCPTTETDTGHPLFPYINCDGVRQRTSVNFPNSLDHPGWAVIDILVVMDTKLGEEDLDGMTREEFVRYQFFVANRIYDLSGIRVRFRVADIVDVDVAAGDLYRQYSAFFNARDEFTDLDDWQREAQADLAFLFKKKPENPIACGVASLDATRGLDKTRGITQCFHNSVFQQNATTRYYERAHETFAHEIGHLLGAQHHFKDANQPGIYEDSYAHNLSGYNPQSNNPDYGGIYDGYGTIMSYADLATGRFSDIDETYPISETGQSVDLGDNGGCFCLDLIEDQPPPTDNVETIRRTSYLMSQLHEREHSVQYSPYKVSIMDDTVDICLF